MSDNAIKAYETLNARIAEQYPTLSNRLRDIASFALEHPTAMALETVANIAKEAGVPPSALIRFAKAFNYSGFSEMQRVFQSYVTSQTASYKERISHDMVNMEAAEGDTPSALLQQYCRENIISLQHLQQGISADSLNSAVQLIKSADHIYLSGQRRSLPISTYLTYALSHAGCKVHLLDGMGGLLKEQCSAITEKDLLIVTSFHPYSSEALEVIQHVSSSKTPYIAISDNGFSPISRNATVSFTVHDAEVHTFRSLSATMLLAQTLATSLVFLDK
ncbi:Fe-S cluster assembly protein HesB [Shewanella sp. OPT22]|nr:Fe-S cluster assembly protein HesB [Shewanella sp. OPT22]